MSTSVQESAVDLHETAKSDGGGGGGGGVTVVSGTLAETVVKVTTDSTTTLAALQTAATGKGKRTPVKSLSMDDATQQQRRSSSRSIKRKKFDDELVESSISFPKNQRARNLSMSIGGSVPTTPTALPSATTTPILTATSSGGKGSTSAASSPVTTSLTASATASSAAGAAAAVCPPATAAPATATTSSSTTPDAGGKRPKPVAISTTKRRRHRNAHNNAIKDIGRWKPQDDLALVLAVQQTNDLDSVFRGVKFSCKFTHKEIEDRWYALLYDPTIAKIGVAAMRQLHPEAIALAHRKALFSEAEELVLKTITAASQPKIETFEELLLNQPGVFLTYRTAKCLQTHWTLMKHYHLLSDQVLLPIPRHEEVLNFSDAEEMIEKDMYNSIQSGQLQKQTLPGHTSYRQDDLLTQELVAADRKAKREIRQLENEIPKWQVLVDSITGVAPSDFDNQTLAVLRGRLVRYLMRSKEITLGRSAKDSNVDVDLSLEGPAFKISRKQGLIKLQPNGDFMIANTGKRPFYVDSKPVLAGANCAKLNNNSVVEISGLRFVFLINQDLISAVRAESLKSQM